MFSVGCTGVNNSPHDEGNMLGVKICTCINTLMHALHLLEAVISSSHWSVIEMIHYLSCTHAIVPSYMIN